MEILTELTMKQVQLIIDNNNISKNDITSAIEYLRDKLVQSNIISADTPKKLSNTAKLVGEELFTIVLKTLKEHEFSEEKEHPSEASAKNASHSENKSCSSSSMSKEYKKVTFQRSKVTFQDEPVPFYIKVKIVVNAKENPKWTFDTLQQHFKQYLHCKCEFERFREEVAADKTFWNNLEEIKRKVNQQYYEARRKKQLVTRHMLHYWAIGEAGQYYKEEDGEKCDNIIRFVESYTWLKMFLKTHKTFNTPIVRRMYRDKI